MQVIVNRSWKERINIRDNSTDHLKRKKKRRKKNEILVYF